MKKMILSLALIICGLFSQFSFAAIVNDGDDGEEIIIEYSDPGEGVNRVIIDILFQVIYYNQQSCVTISFTSNICEINISLKNLSNNTCTNTVINSIYGNGIIPITNGSGIYRIEFLLADGTQFYGFFIVF